MVQFFKTLVIGVVGLTLPNLAADAGVSPNGVTTLRERYGVTAFDTIPNMGERLKSIKIAILDNGYGDPATLSKDLPVENLKLVETYTPEFIKAYGLGSENVNPLDPNVQHGRQMAMLAWAITGLKKEEAPQFLLMNANGFTNFRRAIQTAINEKVDIILNSQNWEFGGNFDGRGHVNREVSRATQAGILWINAAGNYGGKVYNAPVVLDDTKHVKLGAKNQGLRVNCRYDRSRLKITLAWNSFNESEQAGTDKDLDLFLLDSDGNVVGRSELTQIVQNPGTDLAEGQSYLAREIIEMELDQTKKDKPYRIKLFAKSGNFTAADRIRVSIVNGKSPVFDPEERKMVDYCELLDHQPKQEIMIPADHAEVITVGDMTTASSRGPTMDGRTKPDLVLRYSEAEFSDGEGLAGTSNAAAYFAGIMAMIKAYSPSVTREWVLAQVKPQLLSKIIKPGEDKGIDDLGVDTVRQIHPTVFKGIDSLLSKDGRTSLVLAGKYRKGSYIAATTMSPLELNRYFKHIPPANQNPDHFEIYMAEVSDRGRPAVWAYVRDRAVGPGNEEWEKILKEKPELFVQIVLAKRKQKPEKDPMIPLWETPGLSAYKAKDKDK